MEQGNQLVEQRNDAFKQSTASAHQKVLELEQEKVHRTQELHELTSKFGAVQAELATYQQSESEWRSEMASLNDQLNKTTEELVSLRASSGFCFDCIVSRWRIIFPKAAVWPSLKRFPVR